jgi:hypothetical protein
MSALLITLGVYAVPIFTKGVWWFVQMTLLSLIYIALIYHLSKIRERLWLIGIEAVNLICLVIYFIDYSITHIFNAGAININKSAIELGSPYIIQACFFLELVIILGGLAIGVRKRNKVLGAGDSNRDTFNWRNYLFN